MISNEITDALEATVLMVACSNREKSTSSNLSLDLVKFLIEELEADSKYKSLFGNPLIYSIQSGNENVVNYLIE